MTHPLLFNSVFSRSLLVFFISLLLTACSTEESVNGPTGSGLSSGVVSDVALSWIAPVEREDGTPIAMAEIAGYKVYYGTSQNNYTNEVDIADRNTMQATLKSLVAGTYYIVVTTYDMDGRESAYSQVVTTSI